VPAAAAPAAHDQAQRRVSPAAGGQRGHQRALDLGRVISSSSGTSALRTAVVSSTRTGDRPRSRSSSASDHRTAG